MKRQYKLLFIAFMVGFGMNSLGVQAQNSRQTALTPSSIDAPAFALKNVALYKSDGTKTEGSTIVWRNGVIEAVGKNVAIPFDAFTIDGKDSMHVYPGFIDGLAIWGSPKGETRFQRPPDPGNPPYDRAGVQPERKPSELLEKDKNFKAAMQAGFTTAAIGLDGYMLPGSIDLFTLQPEKTKESLYHSEAGMLFQFVDAPGGFNTGAYPSTLMGVMALFRQLMFNATALQDHINYYAMNAEMPAPQRDPVIEALFPVLNGDLKVFFKEDSKEDIERFFRLQDQFGFDAVLVSGKEAYKLADELKRRNIAVLASLDVNDAPDWYSDKKKESKKKDSGDEEKQEEKAEELTEEEQAYRELQLDAWKAELMNIRKLKEAGVQVGYASAGMELKDLAKKVELLLEEEAVTKKELLEIMTKGTAQILGINAVFGELEVGNNASFTVFDKAFIEKKAKATHSITNGLIYEF